MGYPQAAYSLKFYGFLRPKVNLRAVAPFAQFRNFDRRIAFFYQGCLAKVCRLGISGLSSRPIFYIVLIAYCCGPSSTEYRRV
jgi:hypothetical protein